jgi:hypothetical protein
MFKCFKVDLCAFIPLLGCTYLSACDTTRAKLSQPPQTPNTAYPVEVASPQVQESKIDPYAKLNSYFLAELSRIPDSHSKMYYTSGIHELHRLAQREPKNREILQKLVKHQEQTLKVFQICGSTGNFSNNFDWKTLYHSQFWKRVDDSYLVLLICSTSTSNRRFVTFLYSEKKGKAQFKPLKLTRFKRQDDGTIQQFDSNVGIGRTFPNNSHWFDPSTEQLRIWTRLGGGSELCGTKGTYQLKDSNFVLQEFTARFECDPTKQGDYEKLYPRTINRAS